MSHSSTKRPHEDDSDDGELLIDDDALAAVKPSLFGSRTGNNPPRQNTAPSFQEQTKPPPSKQLKTSVASFGPSKLFHAPQMTAHKPTKAANVQPRIPEPVQQTVVKLEDTDTSDHATSLMPMFDHESDADLALTDALGFDAHLGIGYVDDVFGMQPPPEEQKDRRGEVAVKLEFDDSVAPLPPVSAHENPRADTHVHAARQPQHHHLDNGFQSTMGAMTEEMAAVNAEYGQKYESIMASARMQLDAYEALLTKQRNKVTQLETALDSKGKELREFIQALAAQCALPPFHA